MSTCFHAAAADRSYYYYYYTTRHRHHYHYNKKSSTTSFNHHVKSSNYKPLSSSYPPLTLDEQIHESSIARIKSEQRIFGPRSQSPVVCIPRHHMHDNDKLQKHRSTNERLARGIGAVPFVGNYSWSCESRATRHVHDPLETVTRFELWDDLLNNRPTKQDHANNSNNEMPPISASSSTDMSQCSIATSTELSSMGISSTTIKYEPTSSMPIWADPERIHAHRSCYEYVQAYMKTHNIPSTSPMPLPSTYTFSFSSKNSDQPTTTTTTTTTTISSIHSSANAYIASIMSLFSCDTVHENLYCFIHGVAPMWEDVRNRHGGRMTITLAKDIDVLFEWILMSMVGGNLQEYGAVGVVLSKRVHGDRIEIWFEGTEDGSLQQRYVERTKARLCNQLPSLEFHNAIMAARYKKHFSNTNNRHIRLVNNK
ncbi:hypothetical protein O0I10_012645 [Lichtheimia ornata]|uniref:Uncharacterized protein n=1 Tax=Lichtheimia ornata TaxID=688661 RepID=A0AAD7USQ9_9FUNG|nr:uncharacterized protein O0I10_012645 [Lichtheimia ornata]KAJ8651780.1 hypothetical protein O0I10_012645 [Lichtheimia ornata]